MRGALRLLRNIIRSAAATNQTISAHFVRKCTFLESYGPDNSSYSDFPNNIEMLYLETDAYDVAISFISHSRADLQKH